MISVLFLVLSSIHFPINYEIRQGIFVEPEWTYMQLWIYNIEIKGYSVILPPDFFFKKNPLKIIYHSVVITLPGALAVPLPPLLW